MSFKNIFGHRRQIEVLRGAMEADRVPHSYLFYGIGGIGKWTVAHEVAKALNCLSDASDACDVCSSCRKIDHRNHADILYVSPEGSFIKIEQVRAIRSRVTFSPLEGRKRVIIIDDADRMNDASANALLKTLEEPQAANVLILVSNRIHSLPKTVLSRCQKLHFLPLQKETITACLVEKEGMEHSDARLLAAACGGSVGNALAMRKSSYLDVRNELIERLENLDVERNLPALIEFVDVLGAKKEETIERLHMLKYVYRDCLFYKETQRTDDLVNQHIVEKIDGLSAGMTGATILALMNAVDYAIDGIEKNANKQLTLESLVFKLAQLTRRVNGE